MAKTPKTPAKPKATKKAPFIKPPASPAPPSAAPATRPDAAPVKTRKQRLYELRKGLRQSGEP